MKPHCCRHFSYLFHLFHLKEENQKESGRWGKPEATHTQQGPIPGDCENKWNKRNKWHTIDIIGIFVLTKWN
jgi:hypothetical protein